MIKDTLKKIINKILEITIQSRIYSINVHGRDALHDVAKYNANPQIMFDVGANIGQTVTCWRKSFRNATIHSFEPVKQCYNTLRQYESAYVICNNLALGDTEGEQYIHHGKHPTGHSITHQWDDQGERIKVATLDKYCADNHITHIDLLKIDVEGYEPNVIAGGDSMFKNKNVDFVIAELGFDPDGYYVYYPKFADLLRHYDYHLVGVYDQQPYWNGEAKLLFANLLFAKSHIFKLGFRNR